jgi:hypothetical protein
MFLRNLLPPFTGYLKLEATASQHHIPDYYDLSIHCLENLKAQIVASACKAVQD